MSKVVVIRVRYEDGVLKPLDSIDLEDGKEYKVVVEEDIDELIKKYRGVLGKSSVEELRKLEGRLRPSDMPRHEHYL